jgi:hypothetical protein
MALQDSEPTRYPIGRFSRRPQPLDAAERSGLIDQIEALPSELRSLAYGLSQQQLNTPYRDGGWTVRQVLHHVPDSHMNGYVRMKLAATEQAPSIRTYDEARWSELPDGRDSDVDVSLLLLEALHRRWVIFLRALSDSDCQRAYVHPELGNVTIDEAIALYAWHGRHHAAHVRLALDARGRDRM